MVLKQQVLGDIKDYMKTTSRSKRNSDKQG